MSDVRGEGGWKGWKKERNEGMNEGRKLKMVGRRIRGKKEKKMGELGGTNSGKGGRKKGRKYIR